MKQEKLLNLYMKGSITAEEFEIRNCIFLLMYKLNKLNEEKQELKCKIQNLKEKLKQGYTK